MHANFWAPSNAAMFLCRTPFFIVYYGQTFSGCTAFPHSNIFHKMFSLIEKKYLLNYMFIFVCFSPCQDLKLLLPQRHSCWIWVKVDKSERVCSLSYLILLWGRLTERKQRVSTGQVSQCWLVQWYPSTRSAPKTCRIFFHLHCFNLSVSLTFR